MNIKCMNSESTCLSYLSHLDGDKYLRVMVAVILYYIPVYLNGGVNDSL